MPIDHPRKLLFIHIPKTGGTSIESALGIHGVDNRGNQQEPDLHLAFGRLRPDCSLQHLTLDELREEGCLPPDHRSYYCFTFVRNPWERLVSEFFYLRHLTTAAGKEGPTDFPSFAAGLEEKVASRKVHFRPQVDFVRGPQGQLVVDFVGRFECLTHDFDRLFRERGERAPRLPHLKHSGASRHHYADLYDADSRAVVERCYGEDIEYFGYRFEYPSWWDRSRRRAHRAARKAWRTARAARDRGL